MTRTRSAAGRAGAHAARLLAVVCAILAVTLAAVATAGPVRAALSTGTAAWGPLSGGPGAFATTMQLPGTGYPAATVSSDSASGAALVSGQSTWWGPTTPPGLRFGSSRDQAYLNLRPAADNATSPSTTTYTFASAVPTGWGFVLGDIDSDQVRVSATRADGTPATTAQLGFRGVFNLCTPTPRPSGCSGSEPKDTPTWDAATATLTGNPPGANTYGADGWFEPTVPLRTLTLTFTRRTGLPVFQTWFAARAQDVTGTLGVTDGTCDVTSTTVRLLGADGQTLATTSPDAGGSYRFDRVAATDQLRVAVADVPGDCVVVGPESRDLDLRTADDVADFTLRQAITSVVSGEITREDTGAPVPGTRLDVTGPAGVEETVTTDARGHYAVPPLEPGTYEITIDPPAGLEPAIREVTVPAGGGPLSLDVVLAPVAATPTPTPTPSPSTPTPSTPAPSTPAPTTGPTGSTAGTLPATGGPDSTWLLGGAGLLLAGLACLALGRRSRRRA